ncbi:MAG: hypothetical protein AAGH65_09295, partial [Pseudomonadota bacterium]
VYFGAVLIIAVITFFLAAVLMFGTFLLGIVITDSALSGWVNIAFFIVLALLMAYSVARMSILLPARAVGDSSSFELLVGLSTGNGWRLTIATLLPALLLGVLTYPVSEWLYKDLRTETFIPRLASYMLYSLVTIGVLSCAYRALLALEGPTGTEPLVQDPRN